MGLNRFYGDRSVWQRSHVANAAARNGLCAPYTIYLGQILR